MGGAVAKLGKSGKYYEDSRQDSPKQIREQKTNENSTRVEDHSKVEDESKEVAMPPSESDSEVSAISDLSEGEDSDTSEGIDAQRRINILEVPVGPSAMLTKKVFEVRNRKVEACHPDRAISLSKPYAGYVTTDMIIVRWELANWMDAKRCHQLELQWCQPDLELNNFFKAVADEIVIPEASLREQMVNRLNRDTSFKETQVPHEPTVNRIEIFCDRYFTTIPKSIIKVTDTRCEVIIKGLRKDCKPFKFRVRGKVGKEKSKFSDNNSEYVKAGWGAWSPESDFIAPLNPTCKELNPVTILRTAHSLKLLWQSPNEQLYGKVVSYRVFGRKYKKKKRNKNSKKLAKDDEIDWILLYQGTQNSFCVGSTPEYAVENYTVIKSLEDVSDDLSTLANSYEKIYNRCEYENDNSSQSTIASSLLMEKDFCDRLSDNSKFEFKVEADTGSWFNGEFLTNTSQSEHMTHETCMAIPDRPKIPFVTPYHGAVTTTSLEIAWMPPTMYGNGHDVQAFKDIKDKYDHVHLESDKVATSSKPVSPAQENNDFKSNLMDSKLEDVDDIVSNIKTESTNVVDTVEIENLRKEGWQKIENHGSSYWYNGLTRESTWTVPRIESVPVENFILFGKESSCINASSDWAKYRKLYEGRLRRFTVENLKPNTKYEFIICLESAYTMGWSTVSRPLFARTIEKTRARIPGKLPSNPDLPQGWKECWDPTSEYCYYFDENSQKIQWKHPGGNEANDDPALAFRKKRFKLQYLAGLKLPRADHFDTLKLTIKRENILEDSFKHLTSISLAELSKRTNITFEDEDGIDSGGITIEWYMQLSRRFFDPSLKLFEKKDNGLYSFFPIVQDESGRVKQAEQLTFMGRVVGKALYDKQMLDMPFCDYFYSYILGAEPSMEELKQLDEQYHSSITWMLQNDITGILFETFSILLKDKSGAETVIDLIKNGREIEVSEENKSEYVRMLLKWHLRDSFKRQFEYFTNGFFEIVSKELLKPFSALEFKTLINGTDEIIVNHLKRSAKYVGYTKKSKPVEYFWETFEELQEENKSYLLAFITGCPKMPLESMSVVVSKTDNPIESLPTTHTCFNQIFIPVYESKQQLQEKLYIAMENSTGFFLT